jgi:hypothetical protein
MLAYDLFYQNKNNTDNVVKTVTPIKKIYATENGFKIDDKTLEEYGKKLTEKTRLIQEYLLMPLNSSNVEKLNLPFMKLAPNSPKPYIEIIGNFKNKKIGKEYESTIELTIYGKDESNNNKIFSAIISVKDMKIEYHTDGDIKLRLDNKNYLIENQNLYDAYLNNKVIKANGTFTSGTFKKICTEFLNFVNSRKDNLESNAKDASFRLYVIPGQGVISFNKKKNSVTDKNCVDAFGVKDCSFSNETTKTAQFLSSDDPAFTINCKYRAEFYKNLGMSSQSLEKINIPMDSVFNIAGLSWMFTVIDDPNFKFEETRKEIYIQIFRNFQKLNKKFEDDPKRQAQMKIMCFKRNKEKLEILIDENMTMDRMKTIFQNVDESKIPLLGFEILIEETNKGIIWNHYLAAVRSFVTGRTLDREQLLLYFTMYLRKKIHAWIKGDNDAATDFISRTGFCLKTLSSSISDSSAMSEIYAERIGKIAAKYIDFRKAANEDNNSLRDILTYTKYDREKLRFILSKVGQGINLSKARKENVEKISNEISAIMPEQEIPDSDASKDYSYFFYKGVFEKSGVTT